MTQISAERPLSAFRVFGIPVVLMLVSAVGLVAALIGDGAWDALSWLGLGAPVAVIAWYLCRRAPSEPGTSGGKAK